MSGWGFLYLYLGYTNDSLFVLAFEASAPICETPNAFEVTEQVTVRHLCWVLSFLCWFALCRLSSNIRSLGSGRLFCGFRF